MSATRPWVDAFADEMEAKLDENRDKGGREGWSAWTAEWLLARLEEEVHELRGSLAVTCPKCGHSPNDSDVSPEAIVSECADIANFAMMIADVAGGLPPKEEA